VSGSARLIDRFGTLIRIGKGAMGVVFEGFDAQRQCPVAIKMLVSVDADSVRRMQREAAVLARVRHSNVCGIFEFGQSESGPWILMPLIKGLPLDRAWQTLPLDARIELLIDVCHGVEAAHAAGLIHRDLKPANILVEQDAQGHLTPVVMDFGIARNEFDPASSLTATGEIVGTPDSMSPEQVAGERSRIDRRTDVWAMGCLLYRALCDRSPHVGTSAAEVMAQIVMRDVVSPRTHKSGIPRQLARICMQCLEREPERRYADVSAIREDLQRFRSGLSVQARDTGIGFALRRSWRRNRAAWSIALVLSFGILLTLSGLVLSQIEAGRRERLARELGATQEIVRNRMQIAHLAPLHDLRPERSTLAALGNEATTHLDRESEGIRALARRSSGLSALALGNYEDVVASLTPLTRTGMADEVDQRALASAHLYLYAMVADRFADLPEPEREAALAGVRVRHLKPARAYLEGNADQAGLEQVRLLLVDGQLAEARQMLGQLPAEPASEYAAKWMSGDLYMAEAARLAARGDHKSALAAYAQAQATFESAAITARSDGGLLRRECDAAVGALRQRLSNAASAPASPYTLHSGCTEALIANPSDPVTHESLAAAWEAIASIHDLRNERSAMDEALVAAIQHADLSVRTSPSLLHARLIGARARFLQAGRMADDLVGGQALYDSALAMLNPLLIEAPGFASAVLLQGRLLAERARQINNHREDTQAASYQPALAALREARRLRPQDPETVNALGLTLVFQFYVLRNVDLHSALAVMNEAIALLDDVLKRSPDDPDALFSQGANLGDLWGAVANHAADSTAFVEAGQNLDKAQQLFSRLRLVAPDRVDGYAQPIAQLATFAELARARGLNRDQRLQQAQLIAGQAAREKVVLDKSLLAWLALESAIASGESNAPGTAAAFAAADHYLSSAEQDPDEYYSATRQRLEWVVAWLDWGFRNDQQVAPVIDKGEATVKALLAHPRGSNDAIVHCNAAAFDWLLASHAIIQSGLPPSLRIASADQAFKRCQKSNPSYAIRWQGMAALAAAANQK
jgi:hypothetical protein